MNRRKFISRSALTTAGIGLTTALPATSWSLSSSPSDTINVALIGCNSMGFGDLQNLLDLGCNCVALCDVDENVLNRRSADIIGKYNQHPVLYGDFRKMLEVKEIDAVVIGTPDHWHCLNMVYSVQAGKDVYVEKPMANTIAECTIMVSAARKYNRIVQVGQQQRSGFIFQKAMELIKSGKIGHLRKVNIWANFEYGVGNAIKPDSSVPPGVDYEMWLGPAPLRPFNRNRFHGSWRHFWDYGGGLMSDWGVHLLDMGLWAKDLVQAPEKVLAYAANTFPEKRARETFDSMTVSYPKSDYVINWDMTAGLQKGQYDMSYGLAFIGDDATIVANRSKIIVYPEWDNDAKKARAEEYSFYEGTESHKPHAQNFIDCIKSRQQPACTPEMGRAAALHAHIPNIAARVGEPVLLWDDENNRFTNSEAANKLITPEYRAPWKLPVL